MASHDLGTTVPGGPVDVQEQTREARTAAAEPTPGAADPDGFILCARRAGLGLLAPGAWPERTAVEAAAALVPTVEPWRWEGRAGPRPPKGWFLTVGPGLVRLRHAEQPGWEPVDEWAPVEVDDRGVQRHLPLEEADDHDLADEVEATDLADRGRIGAWSPRSRSRLIQRIAATDLTPVLGRVERHQQLVNGRRVEVERHYRMAMVTLTYPGDWQAVCPTPAVLRRQVKAFRARLEHLLGGPVPAIWKLEFQRRGAPHLHLAMAVPLGVLEWRTGRGRSAELKSGQFRHWLSWAWADIVGAEGEERRRHVLAGTAVDFAEAARYHDPKRLAVYFTRHTVKGGRSKAYQHQRPEGWDHPGRWWGFWRLDPCTVEVQVSEATALAAMRLARRIVERRSVERSIPVVQPSTGAILRWRHVRRRFRVRALHQPDGASIVMNDAPAFVTALAIVLERQRLSDGPAHQRPPRSQPLP